jgi:hypothetical protein
MANTPVNLGKQLVNEVTAPSRLTLPSTTSPLKATAAQLLEMGNRPINPTYTQDQLNTALGKWYDTPDFNNQLNVSGDNTMRYLGLSDTGGLNVPKGFFGDASSYNTFNTEKVGGLKQAVQNAWNTGLGTYNATRGGYTRPNNNWPLDANKFNALTPAGTAATVYNYLTQYDRGQAGYFNAGPALQNLQKSVYDTYGKNVSPLFGSVTRNQNLLNNYIRDVTQGNDMTRWSNFREF